MQNPPKKAVSGRLVNTLLTSFQQYESWMSNDATATTTDMATKKNDRP